MRNAVFAFALLLAAAPAMALDATDAQQKCQDVRDAAQAGKARAIAAAIPKKAPGEVFDQATEACLKNIIDYSKFEFRMPSLADLQDKLKQMGQELITKSCAAATDRFNDAVRDATSQVGDLNTNAPGLGNVGLVNTGGGSVSVGKNGQITTGGAPVQGDGGVVNDVVNWFKGNDGPAQKGGKP